jgi:hypothetical protein
MRGLVARRCATTRCIGRANAQAQCSGGEDHGLHRKFSIDLPGEMSRRRWTDKWAFARNLYQRSRDIPTILHALDGDGFEQVFEVFYTAANPATPGEILGMAEPNLMSESFASLSHALGRSLCGPHRFHGSGTDKGIRKRSGPPA